MVPALVSANHFQDREEADESDAEFVAIAMTALLSQVQRPDPRSRSSGPSATIRHSGLGLQTTSA